MKPNSSKLQHRQKEETVETQRSEQKVVAREFRSTEEMLRFDAAQTQVPASVKTRLAESVQKQPPPKKLRSWWRRLVP